MTFKRSSQIKSEHTDWTNNGLHVPAASFAQLAYDQWDGLDDEKINKGSLVLNVEDYGAHSVTETGYETFDSTIYIQNAINDAISKHYTLYLPGRYMISSSIKGSPDGTSLYGLSIVGQMASCVYNDAGSSSNTHSGLFPSSSFPATDYLLDLSHVGNTRIDNLALDCNSNCNGVLYGAQINESISAMEWQNHTSHNLQIAGAIIGMYHKGSGLFRHHGLMVTNHKNQGILLERCGDSRFYDLYINSSNSVSYTGTDIGHGAGILAIGVAVVNIIGGKIEWNNKGIVCINSYINPIGVTFDANPVAHMIFVKTNLENAPYQSMNDTNIGATITGGNEFIASGAIAISNVTIPYTSTTINLQNAALQFFNLKTNNVVCLINGNRFDYSYSSNWQTIGQGPGKAIYQYSSTGNIALVTDNNNFNSTIKDNGYTHVANASGSGASNIWVGTCDTNTNISTMNSGMVYVRGDFYNDGVFNQATGVTTKPYSFLNMVGIQGSTIGYGSTGTVNGFYIHGNQIMSDNGYGKSWIMQMYKPTVSTAENTTLSFSQYTDLTDSAIPTGTIIPRLLINGNIALYPFDDNVMSLGYPYKRMSVIYAGTGTINTSDQNLKQQVTSLSDVEKSVAVKLKGLIKKFKFNDAVTSKGDNARWHIGVIAQEVQDVFTTAGLDVNKYGLFCLDTWYEKDEKIVDKNTEGAVEKTRMGIRYDELLAFIVSAI